MKKAFKRLFRDISRVRWTGKKQLVHDFLVVIIYVIVFSSLFFVVDLLVLKLISL